MSVSWLERLRQKSPSDRRHQSPHFNHKEGKFHNTHRKPSQSFSAYFRMRRHVEYAIWPQWVETQQAHAEDLVHDHAHGAIQITYINHASFLIQVGGYTILTDPVYAKRVGPGSWIGPKRVHAPGIALDQLPKIDVILISHDHYDHLEVQTVAALVKRDQPIIYTGLGVAKHMASNAQVVEMDWWESVDVAPDFQLTFTEVQHFSGRMLHDHNHTLWGAFVLKVAGRCIYFGGDSGYGDHYQRTYERLGAMDLALLPIGAYAPQAFMGHIHTDPQEALQAHLDLHATQSIGMHFGTFQLSAEGRDDPEQALHLAKRAAGVDDQAFITLAVGVPFHMA